MRQSTLTAEPKVSVVTVVLNRIGSIERCIESVRGQTYQNIEYIIVDGGSTDGTLELISGYEQGVDCVISEPDTGIYHAMNKGIGLATGDYVVFLNSDDWYTEKAVSELVSAALRANADVTHADAFKVDESGKIIGTCIGSLDEGLYTKGMPLRHETMLVKRAVYQKFGGYDESFRIISDYVLVAKLFSSGCHFVHVPQPLMYFSMQGISNSAHEARFKERERFFLTQFPMLTVEDAKAMGRGASGRQRYKLLYKYGSQSKLFKKSMSCHLRGSLVHVLVLRLTLLFMRLRFSTLSGDGRS